MPGLRSAPRGWGPLEGFDGHGLLIDIVGSGKGCAGGGDGLLLAQARRSVSGFLSTGDGVKAAQKMRGPVSVAGMGPVRMNMRV